MKIEKEKKVICYTVVDKSCIAYITDLKSQILQIGVLDYFLTSMFMNRIFQFPEYVKQS